jgi:Arc/MetJ family transcription regulator
MSTIEGRPAMAVTEGTLDERLTATALRAAYHEGHRDGSEQHATSSARYVAEHQLEIALSAVRLARLTEDDDLARHALQIARKATGTTPLLHIRDATLNAVKAPYEGRSKGLDREKLPMTEDMLAADLATMRSGR